MVSNNKNRGRCNINKKRIRLFYIINGLIISVVVSFIILFVIDHSIHHLLDSYLDSEVERITSIVVHKSLKKMNSSAKYYVVQRDDSGKEKITYDMKEVSKFKEELAELIQREFYKIEKGDFEGYQLATQEKLKNKYSFFQNGYLCEVGFNSLRGSIMFGNIGPIIPIKLSFLGFVSSDVDIKTQEYGINNVIVETDVIVVVSNLITLPISTRVHETTVKEILSIEIIQGDVPNYYVEALH